MKTIIISDLHLTRYFNYKKYLYLRSIFKKADRIILNGDIWDGHLVSIEQFINSKWKRLFSILRSKDTIYIYGNHDSKKFSGDKIMYFSKKQVDSFKIKLKKDTVLHIEHGNKLSPAVDEKYSIIAKFVSRNRVIPYIIQFLIISIPLFLVGKKMYLVNRKRNKLMKKWRQENLDDNTILVCGHSHLAEFDLNEKYLNSGFVRQGYGQYISIDNNKLSLVEERYN